jgi:formylglycine-generating enzyme
MASSMARYLYEFFAFLGGAGREFFKTSNVQRIMGQFLGSLARAGGSWRRPRAVLVALATTLGIALCARPNLAAPVAPTIGPPVAPSRGPVAVVLPEPTRPVTAPEAPSVDDSATPSLQTTPAREWHLVMGKHWQINGPRGEDPALTDAREGTRGACPTGMVSVHGKMKVHAMLDEMQLQACTDWIDKKWPARCGDYDRDKWLAMSKDIPTQNIDVCMDRFEYPNRKDEYPVILVSWYEARDACKTEGKRLCSEDEWTYACEGDEATPYPGGYSREASECVNDRPWRKFDDRALSPRTGPRAMAELDRLWQGLPSGARPGCKSVSGVYDMTGNIDEWTTSSIPGQRPSVLKGGYWGPVRTRCRPATKAHDETHMFYQQGFRCCADPPKP